jgi:antirestriction protein ArdC
VKHRATTEKDRTHYLIQINRNHSPSVQFSTLAHELAHLCLGHLGEDKALSIPDRTGSSRTHIELEAESAAYLLCGRNGVESNSEKYLSNYVASHATVGDVDVAQLIRAVNQVEVLLKLTAQAKFGSTGGR